MSSDLPKPSLDQLPQFSKHSFDPPAWANGPQFQWGRDETAKSNGEARRDENAEAGPSNSKAGGQDEQIKAMLEKLGAGLKGVEGDEDDDEDDDEEEDEWEDASEGEDFDEDSPGDEKTDLEKFTTKELQTLLDKAIEFKSKGNAAFTSRPPDPEQALVFYREAIDNLPTMPKSEVESAPKVVEPESGLQEVSEEEASKIESEAKEGNADEVEDEAVTKRRAVEEEIKECQKAVWGNIGACHVSLRDDKEAVKACTKALEIDPHYIKALQRRAGANERLSTWTTLTSAQEDYQLLQTILPKTSPLLPNITNSLRTLPDRIKIQQEKEKDEMLSKLKELGNGLLGKFGLNTDMFKFEQQPGGGYGMKFEK